MKNLINFLFVIASITIISSLSSCLKDSCEETREFVEFTPVYVQPGEFRIDPSFIADRPVESTGKIYYYNNILMINEKYEGIHLYDNSNPANPSKLGFLEIPGNLDVSIKNGIMYADSYVDLLTIDVNNIENPILMCRDEDVFSVYNWHPTRGYYVYDRQTDRSIEVECTDPNFSRDKFNQNDAVFVDALILESAPTGGAGGFDSNGTTTNNGNTVIGIGGSLARFSVINNYLYVINTEELVAYDLEDPSKPRKTQTTSVDWGIETLFPYENYLFIGGNSGMYIYDATNPEAPTFVSAFTHANACDPVFVKDDIAYVTLRDGTFCQNFINQLDVINVSDISNPTLIKSYDMDNPHGLSVRDNNLYICEGAFGLKVFENDNLNEISSNRIEEIKSIHAFDIISLTSDHQLVIGEDGLYQYDSSDPSNLKEISRLTVE